MAAKLVALRAQFIRSFEISRSELVAARATAKSRQKDTRRLKERINELRGLREARVRVVEDAFELARSSWRVGAGKGRAGLSESPHPTGYTGSFGSKQFKALATILTDVGTFDKASDLDAARKGLHLCQPCCATWAHHLRIALTAQRLAKGSRRR